MKPIEEPIANLEQLILTLQKKTQENKIAWKRHPNNIHTAIVAVSGKTVSGNSIINKSPIKITFEMKEISIGAGAVHFSIPHYTLTVQTDNNNLVSLPYRGACIHPESAMRGLDKISNEGKVMEELFQFLETKKLPIENHPWLQKSIEIIDGL